jgi:hypothetical protein
LSSSAPIALESAPPLRAPIPDDLDLSDTLDDRIPVTHHRAAAVGTIFLMAAGLLMATGWYRKIPGALPRVRQSLAAWLPPKPPTQTTPVTLPDPAKPPQPVAEPEPSVVAPRQHEPAATGSRSRFRGHPGSIELAPPGPADPTPPTMPEGFPIEPPTTLADVPARDLAPSPKPDSPPSSPPAGGAPLSDAPLPPSMP